MRMKGNVKLIGILVLGMVVLASVQVVGAETTQTWYLTSDGKPAGAPTASDGLTHAKDNLLHKGERIGSGSYFNLPHDEVAWFYADTGAECGLGFGENAWAAHIRTEKIEGIEVGKNLTVEICKLDKGTGEVTVLARNMTALTAMAESKHLWNLTCEDVGGSQDFSTGDWLAVRLLWDCSGDSLQIHYKAKEGSDSYIESPSTDPGYPVPELSTLLLISIGLFTLTGYVLLTKRRK